MANLYVTVDPATDIKKSTEAEVVSILSSRESRAASLAPVVSRRDSRIEMLRVLEKAADDPNFIARLTYEGSNALREYDLTREEKAALLRGDIKWIETRIGQLDDRLRTWLWCRLQQEIW